MDICGKHASLAVTVFALIFLGGWTALRAQDPPVTPNGIWIGHPYGMDNYPIKLTIKSDGTCRYEEPRNPDHNLVGRCEWGLDVPYLAITHYHLFTGEHRRLWDVALVTRTGFIMTFDGDFDDGVRNGPHDTALMRFQGSAEGQKIDLEAESQAESNAFMRGFYEIIACAIGVVVIVAFALVWFGAGLLTAFIRSRKISPLQHSAWFRQSSDEKP